MKTATNVNEMFVCICSCETQWAAVHCGTEGFGAFFCLCRLTAYAVIDVPNDDGCERSRSSDH